jgi:hypothetical protein
MCKRNLLYSLEITVFRDMTPCTLYYVPLFSDQTLRCHITEDPELLADSQLFLYSLTANLLFLFTGQVSSAALHLQSRPQTSTTVCPSHLTQPPSAAAHDALLPITNCLLPAIRVARSQDLFASHNGEISPTALRCRFAFFRCLLLFF